MSVTVTTRSSLCPLKDFRMVHQWWLPMKAEAAEPMVCP